MRVPAGGGKRMLRVKSPQDLGAGLAFSLIGLAGLYFGSDLAFGSSSRMGPGYFPTLLSALIVAVGLVVGFRGVTIEGPPIEPVQLRPILFIIAAILIFGFLIESIGLALTAILLTMFAAYARREVKPGETILLGIGLAIFTVVVFVYVLGQPLPAWWGR
jgi:Tripartite tricarboxylate transporter TctB family